ncbi:BTAD domain-containing putative transcriptional regulator [Actinokineospora sp. 24-640]
MEVRVDGRQVEVSTPKLRVLLAALLARANRSVPVDRLVEHLWGDRPPASARKSLQIYVLRLRRLLADDPRRPALILTRPDGYLITVGDDALDLARFTAAVAASERAGSTAERAEWLDRAEACWRGPALADVPADALRQEVAPWLEEERVRAAERRAGAYLELGRHHEVLGDLVRLTGEHPWRETLWARLILALHRCGRQADALGVYRDLDRRFRAELGIDVGPELRAAHRAVLAAPAAVGGLPSDVRGFAGHGERLAEVEALLSAEQADGPSIVLVCGAPGVGKTAFAVRLAHRLRARFPDGQLHVDLRGFAAETPLTPSEVLGRFLGALDVARERVPDDLDGRAALFRGLLADRRMLVVLDDARSAGQVQPLLPGIPGVAVLITSRDDLRALAVRQALDRVRLPALDPAAAMAVLAAQIGQARAAAEPAALARLAGLCAHLPLALRIAGAHLAADPHRTVADLAADLAGPGRLAALSIDGDDGPSVLTSVARSWTALRADDRAALCALSALGEFSSTEAARLLGTSPLAAGRVLDRLAAANLVTRDGPDRFGLPELIREFAAGCVSVGPELAPAG